VSAIRIRDEAAPRVLGQAPFLGAALALLVTAEYLLAFVAPLWGLVLHGALLLAFMLRELFSIGLAHDLLVALSVLPLIRLLSIALLFWLTDPPGNLALVNLPLIVATLLTVVRWPALRLLLFTGLRGELLFRRVLRAPPSVGWAPVFASISCRICSERYIFDGSPRWTWCA